jgi:ATP-dependent DNA helicase DinG
MYLNAQYHNDFPFIKTIKGKANFPCLIKEDYIKTDKYQCRTCSKSPSGCDHTSVEYGPCMTDDVFRGNRCKYRTFAKDYEVISQGASTESVVIVDAALATYKNAYRDWPYLKNFSRGQQATVVTWKPCEYFNQLNIGRRASHTILNYSAFLSLKSAQRIVEPRDCMS